MSRSEAIAARSMPETTPDGRSPAGVAPRGANDDAGDSVHALRAMRQRGRRLPSQSLQGFALFAVLVLAGACKREVAEGEAPPPQEAPKAGVCDGGGGLGRYDAEPFPRAHEGYCIDPHGDVRGYGMSLPGSLDDVCVELFNGECEVYKRYGLDRVTTLRYVSGASVDGRGSNAAVSVTVSRFSRQGGAYGFFTKRVLGDDDPLGLSAKPLDAGNAGALGGGVAYVWRGRHVLELAYVNEDEAPEELRASSAKILPSLARALADALPGEKEPLEEIALLPEEDRIPLGVRFAAERVLDVPGAGPGIVGHYRKGDRRWQVLVAVREDEQGAGDLLNTLSQAGKGWPTPLKQHRAVKVRFAPAEDQKVRVWYFARRGRVVVGVGDEVFPPPPSATDGDEAPVSADLTDAERLARLLPLTRAAERASATAAKTEM